MLSFALASQSLQADETITIASKVFTESVILGEMASQIATSSGVTVIHRRELGGTRLLWTALLKGEVDIYPEYTGTLSNEIFSELGLSNDSELTAALGKHDVRMTRPLGFNNTYVLGTRLELAEKLALQNISDLIRYPELRLGFSNEFLDRADGWRALKAYYDLPHEDVRGLDHELSYRGLDSGAIDVIDLYSTDAGIAYYNLASLNDDREFFPAYHAVFIYRAELESSVPQIIRTLERLQGSVNEKDMAGMNARVTIDGVHEAVVAAEFLSDKLAIDVEAVEQSAVEQLLRHTRDHLILVGVSLSAALLLAVPLGIAAFDRPRLGQIILAAVAILQTIPSLALFVFLIPLFGIGALPAVIALFLYSLLPIVRNTYSGLHDIPTALRESAEALGLPRSVRLLKIELPLAMRSILAGIKTAAVINVGTATIAALIGAGGYGQPILTGIRLDDTGLILQGAIPAAVLALLVQGIFGLLERVLIPRGLKYSNTGAAGN